MTPRYVPSDFVTGRLGTRENAGREIAISRPAFSGVPNLPVLLRTPGQSEVKTLVLGASW